MKLENIDKNNIPQHIGIIMDGNRRWAKERGIERKLGHKAGAETLENITYFANDIGVKYLTVYAFSTENWNRTEEEVGALMLLLKTYVEKFLKKANANNIRIRILGDIERLDDNLKESINKIVEESNKNTGLTLNIAFNYGGRAEMVRATKQISEKVLSGEINVDDITEQTISDNLYTVGQPDPDLIIRTSGEIRLSGFLLWQLAYSELLFIDKYWPDFSNEDLIEAISIFQQRKRNLGK